MKNNKTKIYIISIIIIILFLIYGGVSWYFSNQLVFYSTRTHEDDIRDYKIHSIEQVNLDKPEDIEIPIKDIMISGWYFKGKNNCGVIFHHGYRGTRIRMLTYTQLFNEYKCHYLMFDARHHAKSTGDFGTFGYYEKFDLLAIIDWFKEKTKLSDEQIVLFGESMGAAISLQVAGYSKKNFKMILAESPYEDFFTIAKERGVKLYTKAALPFLKGAFFVANLRTHADLYDASPVKYAKDIVSPVLIYHSKTDDYTLYHHSEEIYQALQIEKKALILTEWGSKHAYSIDDNYEEYYKYFKKFIKENQITF